MLYLFLLGRVLLGGYFIMNGYKHFANAKGYTGYANSKGVPMASTMVFVTGLMLSLGGLGILLGVWPEVAVALIALFLIISAFKMHKYWEVEDPMSRMGENVNFYKNLGLAGGVLMLLAIPTPWVYSLCDCLSKFW